MANFIMRYMHEELGVDCSHEIVYFAHAAYLRIMEDRLFEEEVFAWDRGVALVSLAYRQPVPPEPRDLPNYTKDYYVWVDDFEATHEVHGKLKGAFQGVIEGESRDAIVHFIKHHPYRVFDYGDI